VAINYGFDRRKMMFTSVTPLVLLLKVALCQQAYQVSIQHQRLFYDPAKAKALLLQVGFTSMKDAGDKITHHSIYADSERLPASCRILV
jgi:hypothetical protein